MKHNKAARKSGTRELRLSAVPKQLSIRANSDGTRTVVGEAVVYNSLSQDMGFKEIIRPGAFKDSLRDASNDLLLLYGHDQNKVCARLSNSSLKIEDTPGALRFSAKLPPGVSWVNDLIALLESDLVGGMSFGFLCMEDRWSDTGDYMLREVITAEIFEISVVPSWAAYSATSVSLRGLADGERGRIRTKLNVRDLDDDDTDDDCDCDCNACSADDCENCSEDRCDDEACATAGCPAAGQTRTLRLRLKLAQLRTKTV